VQTDPDSAGTPVDAAQRLAEIGETEQADPDLAAELYEQDKLFPNIDCRWFGDREKRPSA